MKSKLLLILILALALFLRFYDLGQLPAGIHRDEESHGYNAYSLLKTGKDRYGERFPILFRSFGSYQPPLYTYLATIPIAIFGNTIESVRTVSALAGVILVLVTYFLSLELFSIKQKKELALIAALIIAISPWSIYFSRLVAEGNLGILFFISSILFFVLSLKRRPLFIIAAFISALSTHAYYSERIISVLFLPTFLFLYRNHFRNRKKEIILGLFIFIVVMMPHVFIFKTGALTRRLVEVGYLDSTNSYIIEFVKRYLIYFSPRNLFFDLGSTLGRMPPTLGVYYAIFIIPLFLGIKNLKKSLNPEFFKLFLVLVIVTPVPAAMTADSFYPLRALDLIWIFALIISVGIFSILRYLPRYISSAAVILIIFHSLASFYISYFVLFKYETAKYYGNAYISLFKVLDKYKEYNIIIDSVRDPGVGLRMAYLTSYNPQEIQKQLKLQLKSPYYSGDVALYEDYAINNVQFEPINWRELGCKPKVLLIGDNLSISEAQAKEHNLKYEFEVKDISGYDGVIGYEVKAPQICDITK